MDNFRIRLNECPEYFNTAETHLLQVFERKVLRRIYGPTKENDCTWRIKSNEELNRLIRNKNIINHIKAQRLAWFGHVSRMPDDSMVNKSI
jgi:hypothetical protein